MQNFTMRPLCHFRNLRWWVALVLSISLLGACSLVRLGYNNGESLTYWWLNSYIDADSTQQPTVTRQIAQLFAWHRTTQLPDYTRLMTQIQYRLARPVSSTDLRVFYDDELKKRAWLVIEQALPSLADLALSLQPDQIAHLEKKFADNNDDYRKDHLHRDIDHRQQFRYKKIMKQAEYWFGDFSREQEAVIRKASDARPLHNEWWMEQRIRRQQDMIVMLKKIQADKPSRSATIALLEKYAHSVFNPAGDAQHLARHEAARDDAASLSAVIINSATPEQKAHALKTLQKWIDNFQELTQRPG